MNKQAATPLVQDEPKNEAISPKVEPDSKPLRPKRERAAFKDLPPDRKSEITGLREARANEKRHKYRPNLPSVVENVELHMPITIQAFTKHFAAVNQYAIAIDEVARIRLNNVASYNAYLQEFDRYINNLKMLVTRHHGNLEKMSNGGLANTARPLVKEAQVQTNRSMQMLKLFEAADLALRHASYLAIYGDDAADFDKISVEIERGIERCVKKLRAVKKRCFMEIIRERDLDIRYNDRMRLSDVDALGGKKAKTVRRTRQKPKIDPKAEVGDVEPKED